MPGKPPPTASESSLPWAKVSLTLSPSVMLVGVTSFSPPALATLRQCQSPPLCWRQMQLLRFNGSYFPTCSVWATFTLPVLLYKQKTVIRLRCHSFSSATLTYTSYTWEKNKYKYIYCIYIHIYICVCLCLTSILLSLTWLKYDTVSSQREVAENKSHDLVDMLDNLFLHYQD